MFTDVHSAPDRLAPQADKREKVEFTKKVKSHTEIMSNREKHTVLYICVFYTLAEFIGFTPLLLSLWCRSGEVECEAERCAEFLRARTLWDYKAKEG